MPTLGSLEGMGPTTESPRAMAGFGWWRARRIGRGGSNGGPPMAKSHLWTRLERRSERTKRRRRLSAKKRAARARRRNGKRAGKSLLALAEETLASRKQKKPPAGQTCSASQERCDDRRAEKRRPLDSRTVARLPGGDSKRARPHPVSEKPDEKPRRISHFEPGLMVVSQNRSGGSRHRGVEGS